MELGRECLVVLAGLVLTVSGCKSDGSASGEPSQQSVEQSMEGQASSGSEGREGAGATGRPAADETDAAGPDAQPLDGAVRLGRKVETLLETWIAGGRRPGRRRTVVL